MRRRWLLEPRPSWWTGAHGPLEFVFGLWWSIWMAWAAISGVFAVSVAAAIPFLPLTLGGLLLVDALGWFESSTMSPVAFVSILWSPGLVLLLVAGGRAAWERRRRAAPVEG
jgi:hypothetical protein